MKILQRIRTDHETQRGLLAALDETSGNSSERRNLFNTLKTEIERHAAAEEHVLYARLMTGDLRERTVHSVAEHDSVRALVEELEHTDMSSSGWLATFRTLREALEHHMEEEEHELFARVRKQLDEDEMEQLGVAFSRRAERAEQELRA